MLTPMDRLVQKVLGLKVAHALLVDASIIQYSPEFRVYCEQNKCGAYGRNWMCPPAAGPYEELQAKASGYSRALVFQTVHRISGSADFKGMMTSMKVHEEIVSEVAHQFAEVTGLRDFLPLGAGSCRVCEECAYVSGEPCRFPEKALASLESYGIDVARLVQDCGIPYRYGKETVAYVGCILF